MQIDRWDKSYYELTANAILKYTIVTPVTFYPEPRVSIKIVKYEDLVPCLNAFIDTRTPGSDKKENFTIIGPGVSENPDQYVHIKEPHGFNIGGARQPPACVNSQHSHDTAEVFFVHSGKWRFMVGETGEDADVILEAGDIISLPTQVFRGFENIGEDVGYLFAILGGDDPGKVLWAPYVFDMAKEYGLVLLEDGTLVDIAAGETVPTDKKIMPETTPEQVAALKSFTTSDLRACCIKAGEVVPLMPTDGIKTRALISQSSKLNWSHGFHITQYELETGSMTDICNFDNSDVVYVFDGELSVEVNDMTYLMHSGDTATISSGSARRFRNISERPVTFLRVQGNDA